jgi:hypothetical protein
MSTTDSKKAVNDQSGDGNPSRRRKKPKGQPTKPKPKDKFQGTNQDELKGVVICDSIRIPLAQQYDNLYEKLVTYAGTRTGCGGKLKKSLKGLKRLVKEDFDPPYPSEETFKDPKGKLNEDIKQIRIDAWKKSVEDSYKTFRKYEEAMENLFNVTVGQLGTEVIGLLKAVEGWSDMDDSSDTIQLLKHLKTICYRDDTNKLDPIVDMLRKLKRFINSRQHDPNKTTSEFVDETTNKSDVLKSAGGTINTPEIVKYTLKEILDDKHKYSEYLEACAKTDDESDKIQNKVDDAIREAVLARVIIEGSNDKMNQGLRLELEKDFAKGHDNYPNTAAGATALLNKYRVKQQPKRTQKPDENDKEKKDPNKQVEGTVLLNMSPDTGNGNNETEEDTGSREPSDEDVQDAHQLLMNAGNDDDDSDDDFCFLQHTTVVLGPEQDATYLKMWNSGKETDQGSTIVKDYSFEDESVSTCEDLEDWFGAVDSSHVLSTESYVASTKCTGCYDKNRNSSVEPNSPVEIVLSSTEELICSRYRSPSKDFEDPEQSRSIQPHNTISKQVQQGSKISNEDSKLVKEQPVQSSCCYSKATGVDEQHEQDAVDMTRAYQFAQANGGDIDPFWLLLDSQASINIISNPAMVTNIRPHPESHVARVHFNRGSVVLDTIADMNGYGTVWFYPDGIANCLSLALVSDRYRVTLDTSIAQSFFVHREDGSTRRFDRSSTCNLYYCDVRQQEEFVLVTTIDGKKMNYSNLDFKRATAARHLQNSLMYHSTKELLKMIDNNMIKNCGVTRRDVLIAEDIFGVNTHIIKGKTVRSKTPHVRENMPPVPPEILRNYGDVSLSMDVYYINGCPFLRTIARHLKFRTSMALKDMKAGTLLAKTKTIINQYSLRGFKVTEIHGDNQFTCLQDDLAEKHNVTFHPCAANAHEPFIERDNRTSKERCRCVFSGLPFKRLPKRMIMELPPAVDFFLNYWCSDGGVSDRIPPRQLITGIQLNAQTHCKFQFGEYVLAHEDSDNTMKPRAIDGIYLRPTGSPDGAFFVLNLDTGQRVRRRAATSAHMTNTVIKRVEEIAEAEGMPTGLTFGDRDNNTTINDIETDSIASIDDDDYASDQSYNANDDDSVDSVLTGVVSESGSHGSNTEEGNHYTGHDDADQHEDVEEQECEVQRDEHAEAQEWEDNEPSDNDGDQSDNPDLQHEEEQIDFTVNEDEEEHIEIEHPSIDETEGVTERRTLRTRVDRINAKTFERESHHRNLFTAGYSNGVKQLARTHKYYCMVQQAVEQYHNLDASPVTPQYGVEAGLRIFKEEGTKAVLKELKQFDDLDVVSPIHPSKMTSEDIKRSLPYLMFLKRKRCGKIKARGCADGRPQRDFISRDEASSPTVSLYAIILTALVDAIERRHVVTCDIPGAFLQTDMPKGENVYIRITGSMAELLLRTNPEKYGPHIITTRKGKKILYARANKAIYGTLTAAKLFWDKLRKQLKKWGYEENPYDPCTMNKMINGKQATIIWHVDDLKVSHVDKHVVDDIVKDLNKEFGGISEVTATTGLVHEYLGMTIDYSEEGTVKFSMYDYLQDIIATLPDDLRTNRNTTTPAADHLFEVNDNATKLSQKRADTFHKYVAKLLFAAKRARPDIQTAIAFLCTRVQCPDEDDWKKLVRVLGYIKDTIFLPLTVGWDGTGNIYWYVDASFAVHNNMRSHTGGMMTFGRGAAMCISTKQKLNTKSSTEAELVGVDDALPFNLWCVNFLQEQGYQVNSETEDESSENQIKYLGHRNILYQDNTSSIKLETNGKASSTKRTRHINIRYFLITDKIKRGDISSVEYCPTGEMIADYFTKPLQGSVFRKFRNAIMGCTDAQYLSCKLSYEEALRKQRASEHQQQ